VELHAHGAPGAHGGREAVALVLAPRGDEPLGVGPGGAADVAVGVVRGAERGGGEQRVGARGVGRLDGVPADLRHPPRADARHAAGDEREPLARPLVARLEEELHAEADA
jgi:hypothetical protein